jgi:hypothetical protein
MVTVLFFKGKNELSYMTINQCVFSDNQIRGIYHSSYIENYNHGENKEYFVFFVHLIYLYSQVQYIAVFFDCLIASSFFIFDCFLPTFIFSFLLEQSLVMIYCPFDCINNTIAKLHQLCQ